MIMTEKRTNKLKNKIQIMTENNHTEIKFCKVTKSIGIQIRNLSINKLIKNK